jgi:hypothetical protein
LCKIRKGVFLSGQNASTSDFFDFLLGDLGEKSGLDNDGLLGQITLAQDLEETGPADVDNGSLLRVLCVFLASLK